jgi:hypothetical protein
MTIMNNVSLGQVFEIHDSYAHLIAFITQYYIHIFSLQVLK